MTIIEFDSHSHSPKRLHEVRLVRKHEARMIRIEDCLRGGFEHLIAETSFQYPDNAPHAGLGAMLAAQPGRKRGFIEHGSALVGLGRARHGCKARTWTARSTRSVMCRPARIVRG